MRLARLHLLLISLLPFAGAAGQERTQAPPDFASPNLPAQKIGPDDLVAISVYDAPEFTRTVRIGSDGMLRLPMVKNKLKAQGLMPSELEGVIGDELKREGLLVDPFVTVTMVEYHSRPISVMGSVRRPITFQAVGQVTLLDALSRAEGLNADAASEILVSHAGPDQTRLVQRIPVRGLIDNADPELNLKLTGGEEIRVPSVGKVFVAGNVKKPGAFPMQDDSPTTIVKALALAEGLLPFTAKVAYIYRPDEHGAKHEIPVELDKILKRKEPDVTLQARDVLYIPDNSGKRMTAQAVERILGFGTSTASGLLIFH